MLMAKTLYATGGSIVCRYRQHRVPMVVPYGAVGRVTLCSRRLCAAAGRVSMRFEPVAACARVGDERHAHGVGRLHLAHHYFPDPFEFVHGDAEVELIVHL